MRFDNLYFIISTHWTRPQSWQPKLFSWEALYVFHKYHEVNFENIIFKSTINCFSMLYKVNVYRFSTPQQVLSYYSLFSKSFLYLSSLLVSSLPPFCLPLFAGTILRWHYLAIWESISDSDLASSCCAFFCFLFFIFIYLHLLPAPFSSFRPLPFPSFLVICSACRCFLLALLLI